MTYYFGIFNLVDEILEIAKLEPGHEGRAIPVLDYKVGSGDVLTSGRPDGVGADIKGLINFPIVGTYMMALQSNDGVRVEIGGKLIFSDPKVHADRYAKLVPVKIESPGWYPLSILLFREAPHLDAPALLGQARRPEPSHFRARGRACTSRRVTRCHCREGGSQANRVRSRGSQAPRPQIGAPTSIHR